MNADTQPGMYWYLTNEELAAKVDELAARAKLNRSRSRHAAAAMWDDNAQQAQDELDARKDPDQ